MKGRFGPSTWIWSSRARGPERGVLSRAFLGSLDQRKIVEKNQNVLYTVCNVVGVGFK